MKDKFFAYDPEVGFDTYKTAAEAVAAAEQAIDEYRANAGEGWEELVENVCWGELSAQATMFKTGEKIRFEGEMVDCIDYKLVRSLDRDLKEADSEGNEFYQDAKALLGENDKLRMLIKDLQRNAGRYEFIRDEDNWGEDSEDDCWEALGEAHGLAFDEIVDSRMKQENKEIDR